MAHPYQKHKEVHPGRSKAKERVKFGRGGDSDEAQDKAMIKAALREHDKQMHGGKHTDLKGVGMKAGGRLDKYARGGKVKSKGHHTKINILVAPKGGDAASAPGAGAAPPPMAPPVPKAPMGPPPGGPMGASPPLGVPPPMKRGGKVSGIATKENLSHWSNYASKGTRYADGGKVAMSKIGKTGSTETGVGRLELAKHYARKFKGKHGS